MQEYLNMFNKYVKTFNFKDKMIRDKFHHTYRVMEYAAKIAESIGVDIFKAKLCALFHDIGRFNQWKNYQTFMDAKSIDHGDLGYEIINKEFMNIPNKELVLFTTKNHNKFIIEENNDEEFVMYTKIVRDADKLDIMIEQLNCISDNQFEIKDEIINAILNNKMIDNKLLENDIDYVFRFMAFVFDINFKYTFKYLLDKKVIENKIHLLECYIEDERLEKVKKHLIEYINKKVEE